DQAANREMFEEQVDLMLKCFNDERFSHHGKRYECPPPVEYRGYQLRDITCVPRPKNLPVEVWMPIASSKSIDYMASKDFKAMVTLNGEKILDDVVKAYRDACAKYGRKKQLGEDMIWGAGLYLADTPEEAKRRVEPAHDERYKWFAPFGFVRYADEQGRTWVRSYLGRRALPRRHARGGQAPRRACARRALQMVRTVRLRALRRRAGAHVG